MDHLLSRETITINTRDMVDSLPIIGKEDSHLVLSDNARNQFFRDTVLDSGDLARSFSAFRPAKAGAKPKSLRGLRAERKPNDLPFKTTASLNDWDKGSF